MIVLNCAELQPFVEVPPGALRLIAVTSDSKKQKGCKVRRALHSVSGWDVQCAPRFS